MMKLTKDDVKLVGNWTAKNGVVRGDEADRKIEWLINNHLRFIAADKVSGWDRLYVDPDDNRYWELTYPHGEWHGGGPPTLTHISDEEAKTNYGI
jgi:hypothetical protein